MLTFEQLVIKVLDTTQSAMSADEIWAYVVEHELDKELGSKGKTPVATLSALIYKDISEKDAESVFVKDSYRPTVFYLKKYQDQIDKSHFRKNPKSGISEQKKDITGNEITDVSQPLPDKTHRDNPSYKEIQLHPFMVYYANLYMNCYCKTIRHTLSLKKEFGEWQHPDIIGCCFPTDGWKNPEIFKLSSSVGDISLKLFSFELKRKLTFENLREAFFQAVSNSSWANEGYLVTADIMANPEFLNELRRLSSSFGIGVIKLDITDPDSSYIQFPARYKENLDWETINKLYKMNPDFQNFIKRVNKDFERKEIIYERYDKVLSREELLKSIAQAS
jgi:hypothetical protein